MRKLLAAALVAALLGLSGCSDDVPAPGEAKIDVDTPELRQIKADAGIEACAPGDADDGGLPDLTLPCLGGGEDVDLSTLRGPLVLNLWASWCKPCRAEMPALAAFYQKYGDQVPVLGIDYSDTQTGPALELAKQSKVTYPLLADPGGDLSADDPVPVLRGVPYLLFLNADGDLATVPGGVDSVDDLVDHPQENHWVEL
jgi:thiol-disulfide isomerase/thioredoxin